MAHAKSTMRANQAYMSLSGQPAEDGVTPIAQRDSWYHRLGSPSKVLAPLVDQSECAFRILCRRHGADLCYSPMFSSGQFASSELYRDSLFGEPDGQGEDAPLVVQFQGNEPATVLAAAKLVQHRCNAVDLNLGCPQKIARRGRFGAWLSDEPKLVAEIVGTLHCHLDCPVTCKIRLLEAGISSTIDYARMLQGAGASVVAVHGRTREQRGAVQGAADWAAIAAVKQALTVPVLANGGIHTPADVARCRAATGADGVLVGEALLENPALFEGAQAGVDQIALAREYLDLQATCPANLNSVKQHLFSILYADVQVHTDLRTRLHRARTLDDMAVVVEECARRPAAQRAPFSTERDAYTGWYRRHAWEAERAASRKAEQHDDETGTPAAATGQDGVAEEPEFVLPDVLDM